MCAVSAPSGLLFSLRKRFSSFFFAFSFWYNELRSLSQRTEEARQIPNTFQTTVMTELLRSVKAARESELASARIEHEWRTRSVRAREQELARLEARLRSLEELEAKVRAVRAQQTEADRKARVEQVRMHALAVRQLLRYLRPSPVTAAPVREEAVS